MRRATVRLSGALFLAIFAWMAQPSPAQTKDQDPDPVNRFFPQEVLDDYQSNNPGDTPIRQTAFVAADLNGTGANEFLVVVYAVQGIDTMALVRVLHIGNGSTVTALPDCDDCFLVGGSPDISQIDVDHSGRPEFLVETAAGVHENPIQQVFRWNGTALESVGPFYVSSDGTRQPIAGENRFVDLDGDGQLELINPPDVNGDILAAGEEAHAYTVYKLAGGVYARSDLIFDVFQDYDLTMNKYPEEDFAAADPGQAHIMTLANGDGRAQMAVTGAEIRLNGFLIAGPDRINQQMRTLQIPVTVSAHNTLSVTVSGDAFSTLYVGIGPQHLPTMSIDPAVASLSPGQQQRFTPRFTNTDHTSVTWGLEAGEVSDFGHIDQTGLYTAPQSIPQAGTVTVTATRLPADVAIQASATITLIPAVDLLVTPAASTMFASDTQQFAAIVEGASDTTVSWSVYPHLGFITSAGLYTAPATVSSRQEARVTATSNADRTKSAVALVHLLPPPVKVALTPASVTVHPSKTQRFTAVVTNRADTAVAWSLNPSLGWITDSGSYTAPANIASPQAVVLTATSLADTTASATATINLAPNVSGSIAPPVGLAAHPVTPARIDLSWSASGGPVAGYNVFRNRVLAGSTTTPSFSDLGLVRSTSYVYTVAAYDSQGTNSAPSAAVTARTPAGEVAPGLVLSYNFEEGAGAIVHDASGNGNNGVVTSPSWTTDGRLGGALLFAGKQSLLTAPGAPSLDLTNGMTLEAWVKPSNLGGWRAILVKEMASNICWGLFANNTWPSARFFIGESRMVNANVRFTREQWAHLAVTYDGVTATLYLNGAVAGVLAHPGPLATSPASPLRIGGETIWGGYFSGVIDEVRIYNRAVSASEIQAEALAGAVVLLR
jgi:hypothetical protein